MRFQTYNPVEFEPEIQKYWEKNRIIDKLRKRNKSGQKWYFLQGPPYTSGRVHLGTAWNTMLKDMALRYKRARGFNVWDRNGYDVHGLPTEHKVMAKYNLKTKEDISKFGVDRFVKECTKFSIGMGEQMTADFQRMGSTLDYTDSYMALTNEYMEGEWWLIQQAHRKKKLYLGEKVMTWCANCETAVSKHECEYKNLEEDSIFLKFKVKGRKNEYLIIWTTTPWTIPFNLGIMVNPELDYVKAKVGDEIYILGKGLAAPLVQAVLNKKLTVLEEFKGRKLLGLEYTHPWENIIPQFKELKKEFSKVHTVVLSTEYVDFSAGSGLVHMAPGCGPEDYEVGKEYGIPPFNNLNEKGEFTEEIPAFKGRVAKADDKQFISDLKKAGALLETTKVEHEYPSCWRCHLPLIFRLTKQWFFKLEDLKEVMLKGNKKVNWVPQTAAFDSWTANLKDNSITRQRFWGTPVPIWRCSSEDCGSVEIIGSIKELKAKAGKIPDNLHKPWIDKVKWKCSKCKNGIMERVPDVIDVWIDAGTCSWNCLYYPQKENLLKDFYPADLILEATEQVRLWFSMLSICSQLGFGSNCYKNVYMHGMLMGIDGQKMSKSLGNIISPFELVDKHGADVLRYYMCQTNAGQNINFSWDEVALKARYLQILWNIHRLLINLSKENKVTPYKLDEKKVSRGINVEEKYILSKLNSTIKKVTELFDQYRLDETIAPLEELFLELSRTYIQMVRDKSAIGTKAEKEACIYTIGHVLLESIKMFSIIAPFVSEMIFLNLKDEFGLKEESISHCAWPEINKRLINEESEKQMETAQQIIQAALNAREKAKLGLRWPVKELLVVSRREEVKEAVAKLRDVVRVQTNAKEIEVVEHLPELRMKVRPDYALIGPAYGELSPQIIAKLAIDSPETIMGHIDKKGAYTFDINGREVKIGKEMLIIEHDVPEHYKETEFRGGFAYVNVERTEELEAEGYARELMRQVQSLRKKAGLEKTDNIALFVKVSEKMNLRLKRFVNDIKEKVGAGKIAISSSDTPEGYKESADFKVKEEKFNVWFEKI